MAVRGLVFAFVVIAATLLGAMAAFDEAHVESGGDIEPTDEGDGFLEAFETMLEASPGLVLGLGAIVILAIVATAIRGVG